MNRIAFRMIGIAVTLLAAIHVVSGPARAEVLIEIISVQPNVVSNAASVNLLISGADFIDGAEVKLEGYGVLSTSYNSSTSLTAQLPAGVPPGAYTVTVLNPDASSASLQNALQVVAFTETIPAATKTPDVAATQPSGARPIVVLDFIMQEWNRYPPTSNLNLRSKLETSVI